MAACLPRSVKSRSLMIGDGYPALLRARRRHRRKLPEDHAAARSHRARVEGVHGEAKARHGLARAARRGLDNVAIQAWLTAAAINLKRLARALLSALLRGMSAGNACTAAITAFIAAMRNRTPPPAPISA